MRYWLHRNDTHFDAISFDFIARIHDLVLDNMGKLLIYEDFVLIDDFFNDVFLIPMFVNSDGIVDSYLTVDVDAALSDIILTGEPIHD